MNLSNQKVPFITKINSKSIAMSSPSDGKEVLLKFYDRFPVSKEDQAVLENEIWCHVYGDIDSKPIRLGSCL